MEASMNTTSPKNLFNLGILFHRRWIPSFGSEYENWTVRIERDLKVKQRARENGRNNLPATTDTEPEAVQRQIIDRVEIGNSSVKQALWNRLKGAHDLIIQRIAEPIDPER